MMVDYTIAEVVQWDTDGSIRFMELAFSENDKDYFSFDGTYSFDLENEVADLEQDMDRGYNAEMVDKKILIEGYDRYSYGHFTKFIKEHFVDADDIHVLLQGLKEKLPESTVKLISRTNYNRRD